jgi:histidyl-tRNA synthetase
MRFLPPRGMKDIIGRDAIQFQKLVEIVRKIFEKYGFYPFITPAVESFKLLSAKGGLGEAVKNEIYYFKDRANRELGLRFDLTMPLARVILNNPQLPKPIRRYQISRVWRYDEPQAMRWREFWQADVDVIGTESLLADVECLACSCEVLEKLGFKRFFIRVNNREVVEDVFKNFVPRNKMQQCFRIIDKIDRIGKERAKKELRRIKIDPKKVFEVVEMKGSNREVIKKLRKKFGKVKGLEKIEEILSLSKIYGIEKRMKFDLSLVRGLDYYTSLVYEIYTGLRVSCGGGGRYDNLIENLGGPPLPATGISLGLSRIFELMRSVKIQKTTSRVFIATSSPKVLKKAIEIAEQLRDEGIGCEFDLMNRSLVKQLKYANSMQIPFVVVVGEKEIKKGKVRLRDMQKGVEKEIKIKSIRRYVK